jgi:hypothetical protein
MTTCGAHRKDGSWSVFVLLTIIILSVPYVAMGAGSAFKSADAVGISSAWHPHQPSRHVFHRPRFFRAPEVAPEIIVEQFQSPPIVEPEKPVKHRVYVQPHWVHGGYGVEIFEPGHWTDAKRESREEQARAAQ